MPGSTPNIQFDLSDNNVKNNHNDDRDVDEIVIDVGSPDTSFTSRPAPMLRDAKSEHELAESLRYINPFLAKRHADMQHPVYMREIMSSGSVCSLELSLRSLQGYVNRIAKVVDVGERGSLSLSRQSFAQSLSFKSPNRLSPMQQAGKMKFNRSNSVEVDDKLSGAIYLRIRDLRRLDFNLNPSEEPSFWVRKHAIMISIDPIRAVVMASRIIIIVPPGGMDKILDILERHLADCTADFRSSGKLSHNSLNADENEGQDEDMNQFEFTAIEAILATVSTLHNQQLKAMSDDATEALSYFDATSSISVILPFAVQEKMRNLKNELSVLRSRVISLETALKGLIDDPDTMGFMGLTLLGKDPSLYQLPLKPEIIAVQEEIEELLEAYVVDCNNQDAKLSNLLTRMQNAEQLMALKLDTARNQILVTNMSLQVASVLIAFGAYVSGIFGMNLDNTVTIMPVYGVFSIVWVSTLAIIIVGNLAIMYYYERTGVIPATIRMHNRISNTLRGSADGFTTKLAVKSKNFFRFK